MRRPSSLLALLVLFFGGCNDSPATAVVEGTITFDAQPLANATVMFQPLDGSRGSAGTTDALGKYALRFTPTEMGAVPGEHAVTIQTVPGDPDPENPVKELLPAKYHSATELKATLKKGRQTVDFDLKP